ncbi:MAG: HPr(Ser) kinase/phosphatase [Polyangiaceae bacterium]
MSATGGGSQSGDKTSSSPEPHGEITARALASDEDLSIALMKCAGESGLDRPIRHPRVQKSGLALAGHFHGVVPTRVQVLGETELSYLDSLDPTGRSSSARGFFSLGLSCVVVTSGHEAPKPFVAAAEATGTPLFTTDARSSRTINALHAVLDDRLAPHASLHGVLVDVFGVGVLLLGKSGIGKSECAIELVLRGHRLVADDIVECDWRPPGLVFGHAADLLRHHIEVRGLGVLNVQSLFGVTAVRERKQIDLVVRLLDWDENEEYDRLGLEERHHVILGTPIRELTVPVRPGRDMGTILEIAARNELLRRAGVSSSQEFLERVEKQLITRAAIEAPKAAKHVPHAATSSATSLARFAQIEGRSNESSAWIPAVRPIAREDEETEDDIPTHPGGEK